MLPPVTPVTLNCVMIGPHLVATTYAGEKCHGTQINTPCTVYNYTNTKTNKSSNVEELVNIFVNEK